MIIKTIDAFTEEKFKEKGSVFIAQVFPVGTPEKADEILKGIRKKYYDATHHCYAIKILSDDPKYSDDGEPSGTAGIRILNALNHFELTNVILVVIRYFGGTKLGAGALGKAYYRSAELAIEKATITEREKFIKAIIRYDYKYSKTVHHFLNKHGAKKLETSFDSVPVIDCYIKPEEASTLNNNLSYSSQNEIKIEFDEHNFLFLKRKT